MTSHRTSTRADDEHRHADHPEEAQGLLRESHEEENGEDVEQSARVLARLVDALEAVLRRLPDVDLADSESLPVREHGEEAVLVAVELDLLQDAPVEGARAAAEIVESHAR